MKFFITLVSLLSLGFAVEAAKVCDNIVVGDCAPTGCLAIGPMPEDVDTSDACKTLCKTLPSGGQLEAKSYMHTNDKVKHSIF